MAFEEQMASLKDQLRQFALQEQDGFFQHGMRIVSGYRRRIQPVNYFGIPIAVKQVLSLDCGPSSQNAELKTSKRETLTHKKLISNQKLAKISNMIQSCENEANSGNESHCYQTSITKSSISTSNNLKSHTTVIDIKSSVDDEFLPCIETKIEPVDECFSTYTCMETENGEYKENLEINELIYSNSESHTECKSGMSDFLKMLETCSPISDVFSPGSADLTDSENDICQKVNNREEKMDHTMKGLNEYDISNDKNSSGEKKFNKNNDAYIPDNGNKSETIIGKSNAICETELDDSQTENVIHILFSDTPEEEEMAIKEGEKSITKDPETDSKNAGSSNLSEISTRRNETNRHVNPMVEIVHDIQVEPDALPKRKDDSSETLRQEQVHHSESTKNTQKTRNKSKSCEKSRSRVTKEEHSVLSNKSNSCPKINTQTKCNKIKSADSSFLKRQAIEKISEFKNPVQMKENVPHKTGSNHEENSYTQKSNNALDKTDACGEKTPCKIDKNSGAYSKEKNGPSCKLDKTMNEIKKRKSSELNLPLGYKKLKSGHHLTVSEICVDSPLNKTDINSVVLKNYENIQSNKDSGTGNVKKALSSKHKDDFHAVTKTVYKKNDKRKSNHAQIDKQPKLNRHEANECEKQCLEKDISTNSSNQKHQPTDVKAFSNELPLHKKNLVVKRHTLAQQIAKEGHDSSSRLSILHKLGSDKITNTNTTSIPNKSTNKNVDHKNELPVGKNNKQDKERKIYKARRSIPFKRKTFKTGSGDSKITDYKENQNCNGKNSECKHVKKKDEIEAKKPTWTAESTSNMSHVRKALAPVEDIHTELADSKYNTKDSTASGSKHDHAKRNFSADVVENRIIKPNIYKSASCLEHDKEIRVSNSDISEGVKTSCNESLYSETNGAKYSPTFSPYYKCNLCDDLYFSSRERLDVHNKITHGIGANSIELHTFDVNGNSVIDAKRMFKSDTIGDLWTESVDPQNVRKILSTLIDDARSNAKHLDNLQTKKVNTRECRVEQKKDSTNTLPKVRVSGNTPSKQSQQELLTDGQVSLSKELTDTTKGVEPLVRSLSTEGHKYDEVNACVSSIKEALSQLLKDSKYTEQTSKCDQVGGTTSSSENSSVDMSAKITEGESKILISKDEIKSTETCKSCVPGDANKNGNLTNDNLKKKEVGDMEKASSSPPSYNRQDNIGKAYSFNISEIPEQGSKGCEETSNSCGDNSEYVNTARSFDRSMDIEDKKCNQKCSMDSLNLGRTNLGCNSEENLKVTNVIRIKDRRSEVKKVGVNKRILKLLDEAESDKDSIRVRTDSLSSKDSLNSDMEFLIDDLKLDSRDRHIQHEDKYNNKNDSSCRRDRYCQRSGGYPRDYNKLDRYTRKHIRRYKQTRDHMEERFARKKYDGRDVDYTESSVKSNERNRQRHGSSSSRTSDGIFDRERRRHESTSSKSSQKSIEDVESEKHEKRPISSSLHVCPDREVFDSTIRHSTPKRQRSVSSDRNNRRHGSSEKRLRVKNDDRRSRENQEFRDMSLARSPELQDSFKRIRRNTPERHGNQERCFNSNGFRDKSRSRRSRNSDCSTMIDSDMTSYRKVERHFRGVTPRRFSYSKYDRNYSYRCSHNPRFSSKSAGNFAGARKRSAKNKDTEDTKSEHKRAPSADKKAFTDDKHASGKKGFTDNTAARKDESNEKNNNKCSADGNCATENESVTNDKTVQGARVVSNSKGVTKVNNAMSDKHATSNKKLIHKKAVDKRTSEVETSTSKMVVGDNEPINERKPALENVGIEQSKGAIITENGNETVANDTTNLDGQTERDNKVDTKTVSVTKVHRVDKTNKDSVENEHTLVITNETKTRKEDNSGSLSENTDSLDKHHDAMDIENESSFTALIVLCPKCGKECNSSVNLQKHMFEEHLGVFKCVECKYGFATPEDHNSHMSQLHTRNTSRKNMSHLNNKRRNSEQFGKAEEHDPAFPKRKSGKTPEKRDTSANTKWHQREEKITEYHTFCRICKVEFMTRDELVDHLWDIHKKRVFRPSPPEHRRPLPACDYIMTCRVCRSQFSSKDALFHHLSYKHNIGQKYSPVKNISLKGLQHL